MKTHMPVVYKIEKYSNFTKLLDGMWHLDVWEGAVLQRCLCAASLLHRLGKMTSFLTATTPSYGSVDCLMWYYILGESIH